MLSNVDTVPFPVSVLMDFVFLVLTKAVHLSSFTPIARFTVGLCVLITIEGQPG